MEERDNIYKKKIVSDKGYEVGGRNRVRRLEEPLISYSLVQPPPSTPEEHEAKPAATCSKTRLHPAG